MPIRYVDFANGNDGANGTADTPWKTLRDGASATNTTAGDEIRVVASPDPTSLGQSATWTNNSGTVTLTSAVTLDVDNCNADWANAQANVTSSASTTRKMGTNSSKSALNGSFGTGLANFKALAGATDYSGYEQLSFWVKASVASGSITGTYSIKLCSDASGATPVDSAAITFSPVANTWIRCVVDTAGTLGASIQSVALYKDAGAAQAIDIYIDNIVACKASSSADSITHRSLIAPTSDGSTAWYRIGGIDGVTITLATVADDETASTKAYQYDTTSTTTYKREAILMTPETTITNTSEWYCAKDGSAGGETVYSGGWTDITGTPTRSGETFLDGQIGYGNAYSRIHTYASNFGVFDVHYHYYNGITKFTLENFWGGYATNATPIYPRNAYGVLFSNAHWHGNAGSCYLNSSLVRWNGGGNTASGTYGIWASTGTVIGRSLNISGASSYGFYGSYDSYFHNLRIENCGDENIYLLRPTRFVNIQRYTTDDPTDIKWQSTTLQMDTRVKMSTINGDTDDHRTYENNGSITSDTGADRHTASGIAWKLSPTSDEIDEYQPLNMIVARIACKANTQVTANIWAKRDHDSAINGRFILKAGEIKGVDADVTDDISAVADTYEQLSLTFTPTEQGVVELHFHV